MEDDHKVKAFLAALKSGSQSYGIDLSSAAITGLAGYYKLLDKWNSRLHLVAPCTPEEFATRHVLESLFLLKYLLSEATVIDVGSGGGLPVVPCLITQPDLRAILIESSQKKCVFLREALKCASIEQSAVVITDRFEQVAQLKADFVTCRALDRFVNKLVNVVDWSPPSATLLFYGGNSLREKLAALKLEFQAELLPDAKERFLFIVQRN